MGSPWKSYTVFTSIITPAELPIKAQVSPYLSVVFRGVLVHLGDDTGPDILMTELHFGCITLGVCFTLSDNTCVPLPGRQGQTEEMLGEDLPLG